MLTNLDEVFQAPEQPINGRQPLDLDSIEAKAQHERDRLAALKASQGQKADEIAESAAADGAVQSQPEAVRQPSVQSREEDQRVSVSISETGALKLAVLAADAVNGSEVPGELCNRTSHLSETNATVYYSKDILRIFSQEAS